MTSERMKRLKCHAYAQVDALRAKTSASLAHCAHTRASGACLTIASRIGTPCRRRIAHEHMRTSRILCPPQAVRSCISTRLYAVRACPARNTKSSKLS